ncbi:MAG: hypothetical protein QOE55_6391 [Acidobacteriaceae bacterium]|jgi:hypothetical protein|nr:hypothetical protein [Acidobacteriaceae bacterium]
MCELVHRRPGQLSLNLATLLNLKILAIHPAFEPGLSLVAHFESASGQKKRPQLSGASWGRVGLEMCQLGVNRHYSGVGWRSAAAINFCVRVACFEITSGLFRPVPL